jgi:hypothetical protein
MNEPVTELDQRFSGPAAAPVSWDETRQVLEQAELSWIVTVRADGRPHLTPLVAVWSGEALYFTTGADEQKAVNLRGNPHVILMTGRSDWDAGLDVVVEGDAWTAKWDGRWQYQARDGAFHHEGGGTALVFAVKPGKALAFAKGSFGQTRHTFAK